MYCMGFRNEFLVMSYASEAVFSSWRQQRVKHMSTIVQHTFKECL